VNPVVIPTVRPLRERMRDYVPKITAPVRLGSRIFWYIANLFRAAQLRYLIRHAKADLELHEAELRKLPAQIQRDIDHICDLEIQLSDLLLPL
jgi:hypothetical protein